MTGARASGFDEAIMWSGAWLSTASGNLFLRLGSVLVTPPSPQPECRRQQVIVEQCAPWLQVEVRAITLADQQRADEAMFCNSVIGVRESNLWKTIFHLLHGWQKPLTTSFIGRRYQGLSFRS